MSARRLGANGCTRPIADVWWKWSTQPVQHYRQFCCIIIEYVLSWRERGKQLVRRKSQERNPGAPQFADLMPSAKC